MALTALFFDDFFGHHPFHGAPGTRRRGRLATSFLPTALSQSNGFDGLRPFCGSCCAPSFPPQRYCGQSYMSGCGVGRQCFQSRRSDCSRKAANARGTAQTNMHAARGGTRTSSQNHGVAGNSRHTLVSSPSLNDSQSNARGSNTASAHTVTVNDEQPHMLHVRSSQRNQNRQLDNWVDAFLSLAVQPLSLSFGSYEVEDTEGAYLVKIGANGVQPQDVSVNVANGNKLIITGERRSERTEDWQHGVRFRRFVRTFPLGDDVDISGITSQMDDVGLLKVVVPKAEKRGGLAVDIPVLQGREGEHSALSNGKEEDEYVRGDGALELTADDVDSQKQADGESYSHTGIIDVAVKSLDGDAKLGEVNLDERKTETTAVTSDEETDLELVNHDDVEDIDTDTQATSVVNVTNDAAVSTLAEQGRKEDHVAVAEAATDAAATLDA